ncbi:hypothetical protein E2562_034681 [Oryza meyeriana var. granulata]|uniref:Disease resistance protein At4g27190-like leucine-rich repeats domain-containing protein n=1 Tax=Oryza meyeriana var. granulata TaxID=110450 RepID=A0A6G1C3G4_9ORYZ|nr:hypothetical protein E2562_034681 [Oryza meyeriana var. granulata]
MAPEKWTRIRADSIDEAADKVINLLEDTSKGNVMYFHGWAGLGASSVLRAVAKRLKPSSSSSSSRAVAAADGGRSRWEKIIHVDCSVWQSKRAMQKAIAQELELPWSVTAMFDQHDEDDDFSGVDQSARGAIPDVNRAIYSILANLTFLVVFHNGSGSYIDLLECGVPVITGTMGKMLLWTSRSRFRIFFIREDDEDKKDWEKLVGLSDVAINAYSAHILGILAMLLHEEAEEAARYSGVPQSAGMSTELVKKCIAYQLMLIQQHRDYPQHWSTHAANYWVCSGIIQTLETSSVHSWEAWEIAQALYNHLTLDFLTMDDYNDQLAEVIQDALQVDASSYWTTTACCTGESLGARMFHHSFADKLRVIHLSKCTFSFASPPFLCCSSLRFLLLDRCKDQNNNKDSTPTTMDTIDSRACFRKLWVLDLSYTDWYWLLSVEALDLMVDLRELNVKGVKHWSISHLRRDDNNSSTGIGSSTKPPGLLKLVKLRVTTDPTQDQHESPLVQEQDQVATALIFPNLSSCTMLKTIILDGCFELKRIGPDVLPPSLESFSFSSSINDQGQVSAKIESISFQGCTQLKNVFLRGLFESLTQLDMSGTCIKTLDLSALDVWSIKKLFLLGCKELRAILWPRRDVSLEALHIDTTSIELGHAAGVTASSISPSDFKWYISLRDGRLLRSLNDIGYAWDRPCIEISSPDSVAVATTDCCELGRTISKSRPTTIGGAEQPWLMTTKSRRQQQPAADNKLYADADFKVQHLQLQAPMHGNWMWPCEWRVSTSVYISLQDERMQTRPLLLPLPRRLCKHASSLHVHDSLSVTSITSYPYDKLGWKYLEWCRVERCPNIEDVVFTIPSIDPEIVFYYLRIFWASQLAKARCIWDWPLMGEPSPRSFQNLQVLHLDCCPRLIHVLPIYDERACRCLETLEIVCCGDLKDVFPLYDNEEQLEPIEFRKLRRIHLHDLPSLERICGHRMVAPNLETVKIRGCWSLTSLPAVGRDCNPKPKVDCEKEWWDGLQWDGMEAGHDPSLYEQPTHSRYYKNKLPRGSVLR